MKAARSSVTVVMLGVMALAVGCSGSKYMKIEGSVNTSLTEFPSMAAIEVQRGGAKDWVFSCSGVVLDENHVLTTQSCVTMKNTKYRLSIGRDAKTQDYEIDKILTFPADKNFIRYFAILSLKKKIQEFGSLIKPAKIADYDLSNNPHPNRTLSAVGWGRAWYIGPASKHIWFDQSELKKHLSPTLRKVDVKFQSISECENNNFAPEPGTFCITDQKGEHMVDLDLGGPLFHGKGDEQQLVGSSGESGSIPYIVVDVTKLKSLIEGCKGSEAKCKAVKSTLPQ